MYKSKVFYNLDNMILFLNIKRREIESFSFAVDDNDNYFLIYKTE